MRIEKAGIFSQGNKVKPVRDLVEFEKRIKESIFDEQYPLRGQEYIINECHDYAPVLYTTDERGEYTNNLDGRRLMHCRPHLLQFKIKLFGFEMNLDKVGFEFMFRSNLFVPYWYNLP